MAHNGSEVYAPILKATVGIIFLGTPHRGSELVPWGILLSNLVGVTSIGKNIRKELLRTLKKDSDTLMDISSQFLQRATSLKIMSFIEQQVESPLTTLVTSCIVCCTSAILTVGRLFQSIRPSWACPTRLCFQ
jgi:hypothetical protein